MTTTLTGAIHTIFATENHGQFRKRVFWVKQVNTMYPASWQIEMTHDDCELLDQFKGYTGLVECECEVKGFHWKKAGKEGIMNILRCIGIKKV